MNNRCPELRVLSRAHSEGLDGDLADHVQGCARCGAVLRDLSALQALARELPYTRPSPERVRELAREVALQADVLRPLRRRLWPVVAAAAAGALAASVAAVIWMGPNRPAPAGPAATTSLAEITAAPGSVYEHVTHYPSAAGETLTEVVELNRGSLNLHVQHLDAGERFLVKSSDAEVEVRGTRFDVVVTEDRLQHVAVTEGKVEVRVQGRQPLLLLPGDHWDRGEVAAAPPALVQLPPPVASTPPAVPHHHVHVAAVEAPAPVLVPAPEPAPAPAPPPAPAPTPSEAAYAAGWDALRGGNPSAAAARFGEVADADDLGSEAGYWRIVALARAGDLPSATGAMQRWLDQHPDSSRAGEVHLMLGLRLLEAGDRLAAEAHLTKAASDPASQVSESARRSLEVLRARR